MGEEGARTHLCYDMAFKMKDCIFTLSCFVFLVGTEKHSMQDTERGVPGQSGDSCFWDGKIEGILV